MLDVPQPMISLARKKVTYVALNKLNRKMTEKSEH